MGQKLSTHNGRAKALMYFVIAPLIGMIHCLKLLCHTLPLECIISSKNENSKPLCTLGES